MSTFDAEEQKRRIRAFKEKLLEFVDYIDSWEEIEEKKRSAIPPEHQNE